MIGILDTMLDHHIQKNIVYTLAFSEGMRFSELKPDTLENKAFDYHLKKVIRAGYVEKIESGLYQLTSEGRRVGKGALKDQSRLLDRAYSTLLLAVQRKSDRAWLLYRRRTHPMIGLTGFMHAQPAPDRNATQVAADVLREQTGLAGEFVVHGHGYFRVLRAGSLESFTHFTLLRCNEAQGELSQNSELAEYYWDTDPEWQGSGVLPNMQTLHKMLLAPAGCFVECTFDIE